MTTWNNDSAQDIISDIRNACKVLKQREKYPVSHSLVVPAPDKNYEQKQAALIANPLGNTKLQKFFNKGKAIAALRRAQNTNKVREFLIECGNKLY